MKKKLLLIILSIVAVFCCAFGFAACGDGNKGGTSGGSQGTEQGGNTEKEPENGNGSAGLQYTLSGDRKSYILTGIGTCADKDIIIPSKYEGLPVTSIDRCAFQYRSFTSITIPDSVTSIGEVAFQYCRELSEITIPDSVTSIGYAAFESCSALTSITISDRVTSIGSAAFSGTAYYKDESNWENGVLYISNYLIEAKTSISEDYSIKQGTVLIADSAFMFCSGLTSITIPDGVTNIGDDVFSQCRGLTSVIIPDGVTTIGHSAFMNCDSLTSVTIPDGVTTIGHRAFYGCDSLTNITIPDSVTSIGNEAFYGCDSLTNITIPDGVTIIGDKAFSYTAYYQDRNNWENEVLYIGNRLIEANTSISGNYSIKQGTVLIANYTFSGCSELASVTIPDSLISIGVGAFEGCSSFTSIIIPNSVTSIGIAAFEGCSNLTSITFNGTIEQWNAIKKDSYWNYNMGNYTIHCTDGDISK